MKRVLIAGAAVAFAVAPFGAASAAQWEVVAEDSAVIFAGELSGASFTGAFETFDADITFDAADLDNASVIATIDMASATSSNGDIQSGLPGRKWFHVAQFPQAEFRSDDFRATGDNSYEAHGTLRIREATLDVVLPFTLDIEGDIAHMTGALEIDRRDFGVGQSEFSSDEFIAAGVAITVDITARRAP